MAMKRYTDEEREEAADACAMMASSSDPFWPLSYAVDAIGAGTDVYRVAEAALFSFDDLTSNDREEWAEAEARLRCGWTPGDEP